MSDELIALRLYKDDAMESLADNERCIAEMKLRIEELEFHLMKARDAAYQICFATAGVVRNEYPPDTPTKPTKKAKRK